MSDLPERRGRGRGGRGRGGNRGRGGPHSRGRGKFYPKYRGNSKNQNLESNEWRFENQDDETNSILKSTIENCSRSLIQPDLLEESKKCINEEYKNIEELLSKLSIDEQLNDDFIVPMPPLDSLSVGQIKKPKEEPKKEDKKEEPEKKPKENQQEDLNDWLDNLINP